MSSRRMVVRVADTVGVVVQAEWPLTADQQDSQIDAINVGLHLYEELNGKDAAMPASVEVTATFYGEGRP